MKIFSEEESTGSRRFQTCQRGNGRRLPRYSLSSPCGIRKVLMLLAVAIGCASSFGANEHDPEGRVQRDRNGRYQYLPAATTKTRTATTPQISEGVVVGYEQDFYATDGAYWEAINGETQDRAKNNSPPVGSSSSHSSSPLEDNSLTAGTQQQQAFAKATAMSKDHKEPKSSKNKNHQKIGHSSRNRSVRGGAAGRANKNRRLRRR